MAYELLDNLGQASHRSKQPDAEPENKRVLTENKSIQNN